MKLKDQKRDKDWLTKALDDVERERGEHVRSRFYVVEITPPKRYYRGNGHGGSEVDWTSEKRVIVSAYFNRKQAATSYMNKHEPDAGNSLYVAEDKLYRRVVEEWH